MVAIPPNISPTVEAIYKWYERNADDGHRPHLGASLIGEECEASLWHSFRWASLKKFEGRILRLFETGQLEEARLVRSLRGAGIEIHEVDPDTGRQFSISDMGGHFSGSMDGCGVGFPERPKRWCVIEFKTHGLKSFNELKAKKVLVAKSLHYAQCQTYMHYTGMERAMYFGVCKDTDEIYCECIYYDAAYALRLVAKARRVVFAESPPERMTKDPTFYKCRFCDHRGVCHEGVLPLAHCRTCLHVTPKEDGAWHCARWDKVLTVKEQKAGCPAHLYIPALIDGEQVDASPDGEWVEYRMRRDGTIWRDGATTD